MSAASASVTERRCEEQSDEEVGAEEVDTENEALDDDSHPNPPTAQRGGGDRTSAASRPSHSRGGKRKFPMEWLTHILG